MEAAERQPTDDTTGISEDDRREIMLEIERVAGENRIEASDELFSYTPLKSGSLFPVLVNVAGAVVLGAGIWLLSLIFADQDAELRSAAQAVVTAESRLIEEIRRETEEQVAAKEAEIAEIQSQLASISAERDALATDLEARVAQREIALREQFEAELEAERQRLIGLNLSEEEIEARLAEFSRVKEREYAQRLAQFRRQAEAEQQELAAELDQLESQFNRTLANASAERERLLEESQSRLAELQENFEAQLAANQAQLNEAEAQLARLSQEQERTELVRSQLRGLYGQVDDALDGGNLDQAQQLLRDIRTLLNEDAVLRIPALREQRPVDLFVVDALEQLIGFENRFGNPETLSRLNDAALLQEVNQRAAEAAAAAEAGDTELAGTLYRQAINLIPAVSESVAFVAAETDTDTAEQIASINAVAEPIAAEGRGALEDGDWQLAIDRFASVLERAPTSRFRSEAVAGIRTASESLIADNGTRITELDDRIAELTADLAAREAELSAARAERDTLQTQLREALSSIAELENAPDPEPAVDPAELEAARSRVALLEEDLARAQSRVNALQETISARNAELATTEEELLSTLDELADAQGETAQAQAVISDLNQEISTLREQLANAADEPLDNAITPELEAELAELRQLEDDIAAAQAVFQDYRQTAAQAGTDGPEVLGARVALERFLSATAMGELFPDLADEVGRFDQVFVTSGRENAFLDVADLITELSVAESAGERERLLTAARANLAADGADAAATELVTELGFLLNP